MTTNNSYPDTKKITKLNLNKLAKNIYGDEVYCEHIRSIRRGWYLYNGDERTFIGININEAFSYLEAKQTPNSPAVSITSEQVLSILMKQFPNCIFQDTNKIRPLQRYIHKKIYTALNKEYSKDLILEALATYTQSTAYCKQLANGGYRIDLEGNSCEVVSKLHQNDAQARLAGEKSMRPVKKKKPKKSRTPLPIPEIDDLIVGKMEICVKVNELPADSKTLRNGWEEFIIDTNGQMIKITVRPRTWKKLQKALHEFPSWVAHIRGKMGKRVKGGFELLTPGVQIFEKHQKV
ncbi:ProQ/FinO family protein [Candidatus Halobeggiatoa sp. HSG11]|nr:ProQ/FinO family protein [Candidatus Halobeggiatoa sp. HSG11]